jgi:methyl-accepting chemotaxis protein
VNGLVAEIAAASQEQSQGIGQVAQAVQQMDQVTQSNAATSEESAAAAEELSSQSEQLRSLVHQLERMVKGSGVLREDECEETESKLPASRRRVRQAVPSVSSRENPWHDPRRGISSSMPAAHVIPLDDHEHRSDFAEFSSST